MRRMIDLNRRGYKRQDLRAGAYLNSIRIIPFILQVSFFFFLHCSSLPSIQGSKGGEIPEVGKNGKTTVLEKSKKGVKITNEKLKKSAETRWAICIGINDYEDNTIIDLKKAQNDAKELGKVLKKYGQFDHIYVFTDDHGSKHAHYPKKINITRKLELLKEIIKPGDMILFSFSGHGVTCSNDAGDDEGFLLTVDSYREDFYGSSLKVKDIVDWVKETNVKKALLLLDACREKFQEGRGVNLHGLKTERFTQAEVVAIFYATEDNGFSYEDEEGDFGVFTKYIIEGIKGKADAIRGGNGDGIVSFTELVSYVEEGVTGWALDNNKRQKPYTHQICKERFGDLILSMNPKIKSTSFLKLASEVKEKYIKDLERLNIPDFPNDVKEVEGEITLVVNVSYKGNISIQNCRDTYLRVTPISFKNKILEIIKNEIVKKKLISQKGDRGTLENLVNWILVYKVSLYSEDREIILWMVK